MVFKIYLIDDIGNQITGMIGDIPKIFTVSNIDIQQGFLVRGNYRIPISHILFIEEV